MAFDHDSDRYEAFVADARALMGPRATDARALAREARRRHWRRRRVGVGACILALAALALFVFRPTAPPEDPIDTVVAPMPVQADATADVIRTGSEPEGVVLPHVTLQLGPQTTLEVQARAPRLSTFALVEGQVTADVLPLGDGERLEVVTGQARAVVVGTKFTVTHQDGRTTVVVAEGHVRVEQLDGEVIADVEAGQHVVVPPLQPVERIEKPSPPDPLVEAKGRLARGEAAAALKWLARADSQRWERHALEGDAHQVLGDFEAAYRAYERAIAQADPPPAPLLVDTAHVALHRLNAPERATAAWTRYLDTYPEGPHAGAAHTFLGERALAAHRETEGIAHLKAALDHSAGPDRETALAKLGAYWVRGSEWALARRLFLAYASEEGSVGETALVGLIRVEVGVGDAPAARARLEEARARFPNGARRSELERLADVLALAPE